MTEPTHFQTEFVLDKQYYQACFDETATVKTGIKAYAKAIILVIVGFLMAGFAHVGIPAYLSYFFIGLGIVEGLNVYFARTWWLWRQMMSKAANNKVQLTLNEQGIRVESDFVKQAINWSDIDNIEEKPLGFVLHLTNKGRYYILKSTLVDAAQDFVRQQIVR